MQLVSSDFFNVGSNGLPGVVPVSRTMNVEAYNLNLKGRFHLRKRTVESVRLATGFFMRAVEIDPTFAMAVHGIAEAHLALVDLGAMSIPEACPIAKQTARRALDLDSSLADAYVTLGICIERLEFDRAAAERAYRRALRCDFSSSSAYLRLGLTLLAQGRLCEADQMLSTANGLDPLWAETGIGLGRSFSYIGKFRDALKCFRRVLKFERRSAAAQREMGVTFARMRMADRAIEVMRRLIERDGHPNNRLRLAYFLAESGRTDEAREIVDSIAEGTTITDVSQYDLALALMGIGEIGAAFDALEREIDNYGSAAHFYAIDPELDSLRGDARFRNLLARMDLLDI